MENNQAVAIESTDQTAVQVVSAFNPMTLLSAEQIAQLVVRLNAAWVKEHEGASQAIAEAQKCTLNEATIAQWLIDTANDSLEAKALSGKLVSAKAHLQNVSAGSLTALAFIAEDYATLPATSKKKFRVGVRDAVNQKFLGETAKRIMERLMEATGASPEEQWKR